MIGPGSDKNAHQIKRKIFFGGNSSNWCFPFFKQYFCFSPITMGWIFCKKNSSKRSILGNSSSIFLDRAREGCHHLLSWQMKRSKWEKQVGTLCNCIVDHGDWAFFGVFWYLICIYLYVGVNLENPTVLKTPLSNSKCFVYILLLLDALSCEFFIYSRSTVDCFPMLNAVLAILL